MNQNLGQVYDNNQLVDSGQNHENQQYQNSNKPSSSLSNEPRSFKFTNTNSILNHQRLSNPNEQHIQQPLLHLVYSQKSDNQLNLPNISHSDVDKFKTNNINVKRFNATDVKVSSSHSSSLSLSVLTPCTPNYSTTVHPEIIIQPNPKTDLDTNTNLQASNNSAINPKIGIPAFGLQSKTKLPASSNPFPIFQHESDSNSKVLLRHGNNNNNNYNNNNNISGIYNSTSPPVYKQTIKQSLQQKKQTSFPVALASVSSTRKFNHSKLNKSNLPVSVSTPSISSLIKSKNLPNNHSVNENRPLSTIKPSSSSSCLYPVASLGNSSARLSLNFSAMKGDQYEVHETLTTPSSSSQHNSNATTNVNPTPNFDNETKPTSIKPPTITEKDPLSDPIYRSQDMSRTNQQTQPENTKHSIPTLESRTTSFQASGSIKALQPDTVPTNQKPITSTHLPQLYFGPKTQNILNDNVDTESSLVSQTHPDKTLPKGQYPIPLLNPPNLSASSNLPPPQRQQKLLQPFRSPPKSHHILTSQNKTVQSAVSRYQPGPVKYHSANSPSQPSISTFHVQESSTIRHRHSQSLSSISSPYATSTSQHKPLSSSTSNLQSLTSTPTGFQNPAFSNSLFIPAVTPNDQIYSLPEPGSVSSELTNQPPYSMSTTTGYSLLQSPFFLSPVTSIPSSADFQSQYLHNSQQPKQQLQQQHQFPSQSQPPAPPSTHLESLLSMSPAEIAILPVSLLRTKLQNSLDLLKFIVNSNDTDVIQRLKTEKSDWYQQYDNKQIKSLKLQNQFLTIELSETEQRHAVEHKITEREIERLKDERNQSIEEIHKMQHEIEKLETQIKNQRNEFGDQTQNQHHPLFSKPSQPHHHYPQQTEVQNTLNASVLLQPDNALDVKNDTNQDSKTEQSEKDSKETGVTFESKNQSKQKPSNQSENQNKPPVSVGLNVPVPTPFSDLYTKISEYHSHIIRLKQKVVTAESNVKTLENEAKQLKKQLIEKQIENDLLAQKITELEKLNQEKNLEKTNDDIKGNRRDDLNTKSLEFMTEPNQAIADSGYHQSQPFIQHPNTPPQLNLETHPSRLMQSTKFSFSMQNIANQMNNAESSAIKRSKLPSPLQLPSHPLYPQQRYYKGQSPTRAQAPPLPPVIQPSQSPQKSPASLVVQQYQPHPAQHAEQTSVSVMDMESNTSSPNIYKTQVSNRYTGPLPPPPAIPLPPPPQSQYLPSLASSSIQLPPNRQEPQNTQPTFDHHQFVDPKQVNAERPIAEYPNPSVYNGEFENARKAHKHKQIPNLSTTVEPQLFPESKYQTHGPLYSQYSPRPYNDTSQNYSGSRKDYSQLTTPTDAQRPEYLPALDSQNSNRFSTEYANRGSNAAPATNAVPNYLAQETHLERSKSNRRVASTAAESPRRKKPQI